MNNKTVVISLGGSNISLADGPDAIFLLKLKKFLSLRREKFLLVVGGGKVCRQYLAVARKITKLKAKEADNLGIAATRLNAQLIKSIFGDMASGVFLSPDDKGNKKINIWGGYKPGNSTDLVAVILAERSNIKEIINVSNTDYLYDRDPRKFPQAKKIEKISWPEMKKLVGTNRSPGMNIPFDPVACRKASQNKMTLVLLGNDLANLGNYLDNKKFKGTIVK